MKSSTIGALLLISFGFVAGIVAVWNPVGVITFALAAGGYLFSGLKWLYDNHEKVFIWVQRIKCKIFGLDTNWDLTAKFDIDESYKPELLQNQILQLPGEDKKCVVYLDGRIDVSYNGFRFEIIPDQDRLEVYIFNISVSYKRAEDILTHRIGPVLDAIQRSLRINRATFFLKVKFLGDNPFLGYYLRRITKKDLKKFDVAFVIQTDEIALSREEVRIKANTLPELVSLSRRILALSPGD